MLELLLACTSCISHNAQISHILQQNDSINKVCLMVQFTGLIRLNMNDDWAMVNFYC